MVKNPTFNAGDLGSTLVGKILWRRACLTTPLFLPGESHGQRSPVGCSPWGCRESDMTERLSTAHTTQYGHMPSILLNTSIDFMHYPPGRVVSKIVG